MRWRQTERKKGERRIEKGGREGGCERERRIGREGEERKKKEMKEKQKKKKNDRKKHHPQRSTKKISEKEKKEEAGGVGGGENEKEKESKPIKAAEAQLSSELLKGPRTGSVRYV